MTRLFRNCCIGVILGLDMLILLRVLGAIFVRASADRLVPPDLTTLYETAGEQLGSLGWPTIFIIGGGFVLARYWRNHGRV